MIMSLILSERPLFQQVFAKINVLTKAHFLKCFWQITETKKFFISIGTEIAAEIQVRSFW